MSGKRSLTKDDWLNAAMELLRSRGIGGVRVLTLAQNLRVSRGSFYWHFEDHDDLLRCMLDWWDRQMTDSVIQVANESRGSPRKRLMALAEVNARREQPSHSANPRDKTREPPRGEQTHATTSARHSHRYYGGNTNGN